MSSHDHAEHHVTPLKVYFGVYGLLLCLTVVTVGVSYAGLPPAISIMVAMAVASVKAFFVAAWFMHLAHESKFNILFFLSALWFIGVFFIFTTGDLSSRGRVMKAADTFEYRVEKAEKTPIK